MSVDVLTETTIDRPVDVAASYAADPSNAPAWYVNIESIEWETPPPAQIGSKSHSSPTSVVGASFTPTSSSTMSPAERLVMRTAQGPFPMRPTLGARPETARPG